VETKHHNAGLPKKRFCRNAPPTIMTKKQKKKTQRRHLGISMDFCIHHPRKNITWEELDKFCDEVVELVEKRGWVLGGGVRLVDINTEGDSYIHVTPKHIKSKFGEI